MELELDWGDLYDELNNNLLMLYGSEDENWTQLNTLLRDIDKDIFSKEGEYISNSVLIDILIFLNLYYFNTTNKILIGDIYLLLESDSLKYKDYLYNVKKYSKNEIWNYIKHILSNVKFINDEDIEEDEVYRQTDIEHHQSYISKLDTSIDEEIINHGIIDKECKLVDRLWPHKTIINKIDFKDKSNDEIYNIIYSNLKELPIYRRHFYSKDLNCTYVNWNISITNFNIQNYIYYNKIPALEFNCINQDTLYITDMRVKQYVIGRGTLLKDEYYYNLDYFFNVLKVADDEDTFKYVNDIFIYCSVNSTTIPFPVRFITQDINNDRLKTKEGIFDKYSLPKLSTSFDKNYTVVELCQISQYFGLSLYKLKNKYNRDVDYHTYFFRDDSKKDDEWTIYLKSKLERIQLI
tara:strand:+ start:251 stop:1471 length:1221 start_codon:yes stop_codon:yes gene_type:complete